MVDIGLGPTFGFYFVARCYETVTLGRVQTDAYHRP